jgi:uncharacterized membrane protein
MTTGTYGPNAASTGPRTQVGASLGLRATFLSSCPGMRFFSLLGAGAIFGVASVFYGEGLGLSGPVVFVGSVIGSMVGVTLNLVGATWLADRLRARAEVKGEESRVDRIARRAGPLVDRLGMVGLGLIGPVVFGTFGTALVAPVVGVPRIKAFITILLGVCVWCFVILLFLEFVAPAPVRP